MQLISVDPEELRSLASAVGEAAQELASVSAQASGVSVDGSAPAGGAVELISNATSALIATEARLQDLATGLIVRAVAFDSESGSASIMSGALGCCGMTGAASLASAPAAGGPSPSAVGDAAFGPGADVVPLIAAGGGAGLVAAVTPGGTTGMSSSWLGGMSSAEPTASAPAGMSSSWLGDMSTPQSLSGVPSNVGDSSLPSDTNPYGARVTANTTRGMMNLLTGQGAMTLSPPSGYGVGVYRGDTPALSPSISDALGLGPVLSAGYI